MSKIDKTETTSSVRGHRSAEVSDLKQRTLLFCIRIESKKTHSRRRSRSANHLYLYGMLLSFSLPPLFSRRIPLLLFISAWFSFSSSSSANTRTSVRIWWWCQSLCFAERYQWILSLIPISFFFLSLSPFPFPFSLYHCLSMLLCACVCAFSFPRLLLLLFSFSSSPSASLHDAIHLNDDTKTNHSWQADRGTFFSRFLSDFHLFVFQLERRRANRQKCPLTVRNDEFCTFSLLLSFSLDEFCPWINWNFWQDKREAEEEERSLDIESPSIRFISFVDRASLLYDAIEEKGEGEEKESSTGFLFLLFFFLFDPFLYKTTIFVRSLVCRPSPDRILLLSSRMYEKTRGRERKKQRDTPHSIHLPQPRLHWSCT